MHPFFFRVMKIDKVGPAETARQLEMQLGRLGPMQDRSFCDSDKGAHLATEFSHPSYRAGLIVFGDAN